MVEHRKSVHVAELRGIEVREQGDEAVVIGHASVTQHEYRVAGFTEVIARGAFADVLKQNPDVHLVSEHDMGRPLARTKNGSLKLSEDERGLRVEARINTRTTYGRDEVEKLRSGLVDSMSFAFTVDPSGESWSQRATGEVLRVIKRVSGLFDVSVCAQGANPAAEVALRSLEAAHDRAVRDGRISKTIDARVTREPDAYSRDPRQSWLWDLGVVNAAEGARRAAIMNPSLPASLKQAAERDQLDPPMSHPIRGGLQEARARLRTVEHRDGSSTATTGSLAVFTCADAPPGIAGEFALAARSATEVVNLLNSAGSVRDLTPEMGWPSFTVPRYDTGAAAGVQTAQLQNFDESTPVATPATAIIATVGHFVDISVQALDLSLDADRPIIAELGAAVGSKLEQQIISGTAADGQTRGLRTVTGASSATVTTSTPTAAMVLVGVESLVAEMTTARGRATTDGFTVLMHPRRAAWLRAYLGDAAGWNPGYRLLEVPAIPTDVSSTQDIVIGCWPDDTRLFVSPVRFDVDRSTGSANGMVRIRAYQYAAFVPDRRPEGIGVLSGSLLTTPSFSGVT